MTTKEEALTIECPKCQMPPGQMCVTLGPTFVVRPSGYGNADHSQIGREAKVPHNERRNEYFWTHLPERDETLRWMKPTRNWAVKSKDGYYVIWVGRPWDHSTSIEATALVGSLRCRMVIGTFATIDEAKVACQEHSDLARRGVCDCESYEPCYGECCGVGNCTCTPGIAEAHAERLGIDISTEGLMRKIEERGGLS